jgi:hypothetical protein
MSTLMRRSASQLRHGLRVQTPVVFDLAPIVGLKSCIDPSNPSVLS